MLKTSNTKSAKLRKGIIGVSNSRKEYSNRAEPVGKDKIDDSEVEDNEVRKKDQKTSKSKKLSKFKKIVGSNFFTPGARLRFTKLR